MRPAGDKTIYILGGSEVRFGYHTNDALKHCIIGDGELK